MVVSHAPLSDIINNKDATGRMAKWAIKLLSFKINYKPCSTIKSHAIANFIVKWIEAQEVPKHIDLEYWITYFDGSMNV